MRKAASKVAILISTMLSLYPRAVPGAPYLHRRSGTATANNVGGSRSISRSKITPASPLTTTAAAPLPIHTDSLKEFCKWQFCFNIIIKWQGNPTLLQQPFESPSWFQSSRNYPTTVTLTQRPTLCDQYGPCTAQGTQRKTNGRTPSRQDMVLLISQPELKERPKGADKSSGSMHEVLCSMLSWMLCRAVAFAGPTTQVKI